MRVSDLKNWLNYAIPKSRSVNSNSDSFPSISFASCVFRGGLNV
jgi:hypothetical protein